MRTLSHILVVSLALGVIVGASSPAAAAEDITVEVRSIAANKEGGSFDDDLDDIQTKLEKAFGSYSDFEELSRLTLGLSEGESESAKLPEGSTFSVTFNGEADDLLKVGVEIGGKLSTTLRTSPGSTFFQAGLSYGKGILILAITVDESD